MSAAEMHRELAGVFRRHGQERTARAHEYLARLLEQARDEREGRRT